MLRLATRDRPVPGPGQMLIAVAAAGVNRHDCNQRQAGAHHDGTPVPGLEVAGTVAACGAEVEGWPAGTPVMALVQGGGYAGYALAEAALALPVPDGLSLDQAAGLPEALFTAWWNFFGLMRLIPGEVVLIHGGTSGVGHIAIQALSALGYRVIATCGSDDKLLAARRFGAFAAISYRAEDLAGQVLAATDGAGVDALLDMSAGAHLEADMQMMAPGGRIAHLSPGRGAVLAVPLRTLMARRIAITGSLLRPLPLALKAGVAAMLRRDAVPLLGRSVRPHIAATFPLDQAAQAHAMMEAGRHIGKILLRP